MVIDKFHDEYGFLSNFYGSHLTVEHYYQANKTLDVVWKDKILGAKTPGKAKRLGAKAPLRPGWNSIRYDIMVKLVREKFRKPDLAMALINTHPYTLVEGNGWHDNYWGNCSCDKCKDRKGLNHLGLILMTVRGELIKLRDKY